MFLRGHCVYIAVHLLILDFCVQYHVLYVVFCYVVLFLAATFARSPL